MKKLVAALLFAVLFSGSCKDEDLTGDISVTTNGAFLQGGESVGLFDSSVSLNPNGFRTADAIILKPVINSAASFDDVNPGNYVVAVAGTNYLFHAVQVKAGQRVTVNVP